MSATIPDPGTWSTHNTFAEHMPNSAPNQIRDSKGAVIAWVAYNGDRDQTAANGRLIAAAPELLDALKGLMDDPEGSFAWEKATAAIAKATQP